MQTIEIDFEVYKALTNLRENETVTYNDVIRKLVKLPPKHKGLLPRLSELLKVNGLHYKDVFFPEGSRIKTIFKGKLYLGAIQNCKFTLEDFPDESFESPSAAAMRITENNVNGWKFWDIKIPNSDKWESLESYRLRTTTPGVGLLSQLFEQNS